ncbi:MAG: hypothetical protein ABJ246_13095 [Paracoccaceae bacterium]
MIFKAFAALLLGTSAFAADPIGTCENLCGSHFCEVGHTDIGAGVVTYRIGEFGHGGGAQTEFVEACASGHRLQALLFLANDDFSTLERTVELDVGVQAKAVLSEVIRSQVAYSFEDLAARLTDVGARVAIDKRTEESCACNRAYPELRGSKTKFEWYQ